MATRISRPDYAAMYGPTTGDRVRLGDTDIIIEVEHDLTTYGEEVKFGGGKVIRDGMGQSQIPRSGGAVDTVITNALILDPILGVIKADIGVKHGRVVGIGHAGNPGIQPGLGSIFPDPATGKPNPMIVGAGTEAIAGEGCIVTAGGIDTHIHFICPQQIDEAISSGVTTLIGGGTGPAHGTLATTCTPGPANLARMLQAADTVGDTENTCTFIAKKTVFVVSADSADVGECCGAEQGHEFLGKAILGNGQANGWNFWLRVSRVSVVNSV